MVFYAAGGGAASNYGFNAPGGLGGGGSGSGSGTGGSAGTVNTGGGGGGGAGAGGSGIVIVVYQSATQKGTGGTVTSYTYSGATVWVHKFTTSGTFTA